MAGNQTLISFQQLLSGTSFYSYFKFIIAIGTVQNVIGLWANAVNIRAFYRMRLSDSITILFFSIAVLDFAQLFCSLVSGGVAVTLILDAAGTKFPVQPAIVQTYVTPLTRGFTETSFLLTTFLAIQRCLCIAKPLQFKGMFTRSATSLIVVTIGLISVGFTTVLVVYTGYVHVIFNPLTNTSIHIVAFRPGRDIVNNVYSTTFSVVLNVTNQLIVTVCVFVMARALKKSVRFRKMTSASGTSSELEKKEPEETNSKEKQAIVQVSLVSTIFLLCNFTRLLFTFASFIWPDFQLRARLHFTFLSVYYAIALLEGTNATVNFFIYYAYNSKFRRLCFRPRQKSV